MVRYGLTNYAADVALDQDADGATTWEEYVVGTDPTNGQSVFTIHLEYPVLSWNVVPGRYYTVTSPTNLNAGFDTQVSNLLSGSYTDTVHQTARKLYYRVEVGVDNL